MICEEPLEVRLVYGPADDRKIESFYVTMRTPGNDIELAVGFLVCEGIIEDGKQIQIANHFGPSSGTSPARNTVKVELKPNIDVAVKGANRKFLTNSSCGVCGKDSIEAIEKTLRKLDSKGSHFTVSAETICRLPDTLRKEQTWFQATGGIHACGLFLQNGQLVSLREDVGRHNALDKLIGRAVMDNQIPVANQILLLSGRVSFELMQKAIVAGISMVVAVGAPSDLAIELAKHFEITLVGFTSKNRFNVYSHTERIQQ